MYVNNQLMKIKKFAVRKIFYFINKLIKNIKDI